MRQFWPFVAEFVGFNHCIFCLPSHFVLNEILLFQFGSHASACLSHVSDIELKVKHLSLSRSLGGWGEVLCRERGEKQKNEEENKGIDAREGGWKQRAIEREGECVPARTHVDPQLQSLSDPSTSLRPSVTLPAFKMTVCVRESALLFVGQAV